MCVDLGEMDSTHTAVCDAWARKKAEIIVNRERLGLKNTWIFVVAVIDSHVHSTQIQRRLWLTIHMWQLRITIAARGETGCTCFVNAVP